jgi:hypothetical protein
VDSEERLNRFASWAKDRFNALAYFDDFDQFGGFS